MDVRPVRCLSWAITFLLLPTASLASLCTGLITDKSNYPMTQLDKPGYLQSVTDPEFGTRIIRVTQTSDVTKPAYSTMPVWNADESLMFLWDRQFNKDDPNSRGHILLDGKTYEFIRNLDDINPNKFEELTWHATNPDIMFYPASHEENGQRIKHFIQYNVKTREKVVLRDFGDMIDSNDGFGFGGDPMYSSWDSDVFGFADSDTRDTHFAYRISTDTVSPNLSRDEAEHPAPGPSGEYFFWNAGVYDFNMNKLHTLDMGNSGEHAVLSRFKNGHDGWFGVQFGGPHVGSLVAYDLVTGEGRVVVGENTGYPYPPTGHHFSAVRTEPGWIAISIIGGEDGQDLFDNELLLVNANPGEEEVCRVAHHRSRKQGGRGYWSEPHANVSPSGTRIAFASDWGTDKVDTYVVELPAYNPDNVPDYDNGNTDNGNTDNGDTDNGDTDNGNTDNGDTDNGDTDNGNTDNGDTDNGDTDNGNTDNGNTDNGNNAGEQGSHTITLTGSVDIVGLLILGLAIFGRRFSSALNQRKVS